MPIQDAVSPVQKVTTSEMSQDFMDHFAVVSWEDPGVEADNKIAVTLQLMDPLDADLAVKERIRLTCTTGATMNLALDGDGTVLSGVDSDDMIIETDEATGCFELEVTYADSGTVTVVGGATQGSGFLHCGLSVDLTFAGE